MSLPDKDRLPVFATRHDMIEQSFSVESEMARHRKEIIDLLDLGKSDTPAGPDTPADAISAKGFINSAHPVHLSHQNPRLIRLFVVPDPTANSSLPFSAGIVQRERKN